MQLIQDWVEGVIYNRTGAVPTQSTITIIWSIAVSIFCIGGMIGGAITGKLISNLFHLICIDIPYLGVVADQFGRKGGLLLNNVLVILATISEGAAKSAGSYEMIILGRFLIGINSGLNAGLAPMYLAEISPINLRGAVGTVYQLVITISILVAQVLGLKSILGSADYWPTLLAMTVVPALFQVSISLVGHNHHRGINNFRFRFSW